MALRFEPSVFDLAQVVLGELDLGGGDVLFEPEQLGGAGDGDDPCLLCEEPGERDLRRRRILTFRELAQQLDERAVRLAGVFLEAWVVGPSDIR